MTNATLPPPDLTRPALSPEYYDSQEAEGRIHLSNRVIEAFQPDVFNVLGYPTRVTDERELRRYVDVMHETRLRRTVDDLLGGLTTREFATFQDLVRFTADLTAALFGRPLHCENALLRAFNIYRYVAAAEPDVVLEIGPGSGYLGLLLIHGGTGYVAVENTQAFYLAQNRLWGAAAGERLVELAQEPVTLREALARAGRGCVVHVPWWKVVDLDPGSIEAQIGLVTANHCLAEMHENALGYYLRLAHRLLAPGRGSFVFEGWGYDIRRSVESVAREFDTAGFSLLHSTDKVNALVPRENSEGVQYEFPRRVPSKVRIQNTAIKFLGLKGPDYEYSVQRFLGDNPVSRRFREVERRVGNKATVSSADVLAFLREVYTSPNEEELFLELIGRRYG